MAVTDNRALAGWTGSMTAWAGQGREVFCYFDNDEQGHAEENALALKQMVKAWHAGPTLKRQTCNLNQNWDDIIDGLSDNPIISARRKKHEQQTGN